MGEKKRLQRCIRRLQGEMFIILIMVMISTNVYRYLGFPGGASGTEPACQCFDPWVWKVL